MARSVLEHVDITLALAATIMLCSLLAQRFSSQDTEIWSEILTWTILFALIRGKQESQPSSKVLAASPAPRPPSSACLWVIAISITVTSVYKAEVGMIESFPFITPLVVVCQELSSGGQPALRSLYSLVNSAFLLRAVLCALIVIPVLSRRGYTSSTLSLVAVIPQTIVYLAFLPKPVPNARHLPWIGEAVESSMGRLSRRVLTCLVAAAGAQTMTFGLTEIDVLAASLSGILKAIAWFFLIRIRQYASWGIAPAIETFALTTICSPFIQTYESYAALNVMASVLSLVNVIYMIPRRVKSRSILGAFAFATIMPYLLNFWAIEDDQFSARRSLSGPYEHPVETLANHAKKNFESLLQRQSKDYAAACSDYRRRYQMEPPPGFEDWYDFAKYHQSVIIDDFDIMYESVSLFWELSGAELLQIMDAAEALPDAQLCSCTFDIVQADTWCTHPPRTFDRHVKVLFNKLPKNILPGLPEVRFNVNHIDEPRILIPPRVSEGGDKLVRQHLNLTNLSRRRVWSSLTKYCASERRNTSSMGDDPIALPFVTDVPSALDLCHHEEYADMHGILRQPNSFRLFEGLVPILSVGTLSTMGDILFPSPAYIEDEFRYDQAHDPDWNMKHTALYWAGSTTGGHASDDHWRYFHRQRFVTLAQNLEVKHHTYLRKNGGMIVKKLSTFLNKKLFDVAFTKVSQCTTKACRDEKRHFEIRPWASKYEALKSRLVFDIDGNGISGRYYQLLASKSVPLKQTLLREWHDDRLIPWLHYIPVSLSMEELPELVSYLTYTAPGQGIAKEIADRGRDWHSRAFREIDLVIYIYRLLLEMARLQDPTRPARGEEET